MYRFLLVFLIAANLSVNLTATELPFHRGLNITEWFQAESASRIQFTKYTRQDFVNLATLGCDHIRLPIHLHNMSGNAPDYRIDPLLFDFLDQVVDWAEELNLYLILDNHSFDPFKDTDPAIVDRLVAVWQQVAAHYKDRSQFILYEILNEPHGIEDAVWNDMQGRVIRAIRAIDSTHTIVVGPANWNSYDHLKNLPEYEEDNLIYTFHFYDPFLFTHQGATWVDPPMDIAGVPYPYDASRMPALPSQLRGTWIGWLYTYYPMTGNDEWVKGRIDIAADFMRQRNVPVWCGEFGVYQLNSPPQDRAYWIKTVRSYFEEQGISWTMWEFRSGFGVFEKGSDQLFDYDLDLPVVEALGLTPVPQKEFVLRPDTTGFTIYDDYIAAGLFANSWIEGGELDYYSTNDPKAGKYCIYWTGASRYNCISARFRPIKDLSELVRRGFVIDFWIRSDRADTKLDIRFLDTKTDDPDDHPWRMRYTLDASVVTFDGTWQHVRIPLKDFTEHGAWDNNRWYNPQGKFDWSQVDQFQIVAEYGDLQGIHLYFDEIRVLDTLAVRVGKRPSGPEEFALLQNYPNPFNPTTTIPFSLKQSSDVDFMIFNIRGDQVYGIKKRNLAAGQHAFVWQAIDRRGNPLPSGVYFCRIKANDSMQTRRMVLLR